MSTTTSESWVDNGHAPAPRLVLTAIVGSTLPVLVGLTLLVSAWSKRPLLSLRQWGWAVPPGMRARTQSARRATIVWSLIFFVAGLFQVAIELGTDLTIASPAGFLTRTAGALVVETAAAAWLWSKAAHRQPDL